MRSKFWTGVWSVIAMTTVLFVITNTSLAQDPRPILKEAKNLSDDDLKQKVTTAIADMKVGLNAALDLVATTQAEEKDILKLNCINDKLGPIKGFLKVSEQSDGKLQTALASGDRATAEHQYALVMLAKQKVGNLGVEAQSCAGEVLRYSGETQAAVEITGVPELDPTILLTDLETLFKVTEATPYQ